jgi:hypothetical protein
MPYGQEKYTYLKGERVNHKEEGRHPTAEWKN